MSHCQIAGHDNIKVANKSSGIVAEVKYLTAGITNENCMREEVKNNLNLGVLATVLFRSFCFPNLLFGIVKRV